MMKKTAYKEIAGVYEMVSIEGTHRGVSVSKNYFKYNKIILKSNGIAIFKSKSFRNYKEKVRYRYKDGKIYIEYRINNAHSAALAYAVTEIMIYDNGRIIYSFDDSKKTCVTLEFIRKTNKKQ